MRRWLAHRVMARDEAFRWVPKRALRWAFDYMFDHGVPVRFAISSNYQLIEINPQPRTWASSAWIDQGDS